MSLASLLVEGSDPRVFAFEHAMAHRGMMMALPNLADFSAVPYLLDPEQDTPLWRLYHQSAHDDALGPPPPLGPFGVPYPQNLIDTNQGDPRQRPWWIFTNHQSHITASGNILEVQWPLRPAW